MTTYLLLWNPKGFPTQRLLDEIEHNRQVGSPSSRWNVATRSPKPSDRFFMMRVGSQQGIIGCGRVVSGVTRQPNWDPAKAAEGKTQLFVQVAFDDASEVPLIPLAELREPPFAGFRWTPLGSGVRVPEALAAQLEQRWSDVSAVPRKCLFRRS